MDLGNLTLFQMIRRSVDYQAQRQSVIAENIANADTPDYRPRDLPSFAQVLADSPTGGNRLVPVRTHGDHISGKADGAPGAREHADVYEAAPSGNEVVLEQQLIALNETTMQHQLSMRLMDRHLNMVRTALGRGQ